VVNVPDKDARWKSISIPDEAAEKIQKIIDQNPDMGFTSVGQFVMAALRDYRLYNVEVKPEKQKPKVGHS